MSFTGEAFSRVQNHFSVKRTCKYEFVTAVHFEHTNFLLLTNGQSGFLFLSFLNHPVKMCPLDDNADTNMAAKTYCLKSVGWCTVNKSTPWQQPAANAIHIPPAELGCSGLEPNLPRRLRGMQAMHTHTKKNKQTQRTTSRAASIFISWCIIHSV